METGQAHSQRDWERGGGDPRSVRVLVPQVVEGCPAAGTTAVNHLHLGCGPGATSSHTHTHICVYICLYTFLNFIYASSRLFEVCILTSILQVVKLRL